jgi:hypothetical protein
LSKTVKSKVPEIINFSSPKFVIVRVPEFLSVVDTDKSIPPERRYLPLKLPFE